MRNARAFLAGIVRTARKCSRDASLDPREDSPELPDVFPPGVTDCALPTPHRVEIAEPVDPPGIPWIFSTKTSYELTVEREYGVG